MKSPLYSGLLVLALFIIIGAGCNQAAEILTEPDTTTPTTQESDREEMEDDMMEEEEEEEEINDEDEMEDEEEETQASSGSYEAYDESKIARAANGDVVIFFNASWCPSCRTIDKDIMENVDDIPADLTILDADYDEETELKRKYGVTTQHTFVQVDADGNMIQKWTGGVALADILKNL